MHNWDDMRVFLAVARAEGLSAAAPGLRMDPATLSRRIARLEAAFGGSLFLKSPRGYALTGLGERIHAEAQAAEEAMGRAWDAGRAVDGGLSGQIRIGAPDGSANYLLPQVCAAMRAENPQLELQILALPRVVNLSRREADLAITVSPPQAGRLTVQKITDYHLHLAQHRDLPVPQTLDEVRAGPVVGYIQDMIFDKELDYLNALGSPAVPLASNSFAVQVQMLRQRAGAGIVHDFVMPFVPELRFILPESVALRRAFYLVRHASDARSERLRRVAERLSEGLRAEVARLEAEARLTGAARVGNP